VKEKTSIIMAVIAVICIIAVCLVWRSCGSEASVTCPNGAKVELESRGSFEGAYGIEDVCKEIEGTNNEQP
jgi:hypothetical protein